MAALQVVFGQTGLGLAVASESERATPRAVIQVTLMKPDTPGTDIKLEGVFVGGSAGNAEGKLLQVGVTQTPETKESSWLSYSRKAIYALFILFFY